MSVTRSSSLTTQRGSPAVISDIQSLSPPRGGSPLRQAPAEIETSRSVTRYALEGAGRYNPRQAIRGDEGLPLPTQPNSPAHTLETTSSTGLQFQISCGSPASNVASPLSTQGYGEARYERANVQDKLERREQGLPVHPQPDYLSPKVRIIGFNPNRSAPSSLASREASPAPRKSNASRFTPASLTPRAVSSAPASFS